MDKGEIIESPLLKRYIKSRNVNPHTAKNIQNHISKYCQFTGQTPEQLIEEADEEEEKNIRFAKRKINDKLEDYKLVLYEKISVAAVRGHFATIKAFYKYNKIQVPDIRITEGKITRHHEETLTKEHINEAIKHSSIKYRAIILLMASSGMGTSEIRNLTHKDYQNACKGLKSKPYEFEDIIEEIQEENFIPTWKIKRYKTGMPYVTFSSPESFIALIDYLKQVKVNESIEDSENEWLITGIPKTKTSRRSIAKYFKEINRRCDYKKHKGKWFFRSHKLRKFFASTLYKNNVHKLMIDWFLGHRIPEQDEAYFISDPEHLKKVYKEVLPELSINPVKYIEIPSEETEKLRRANKHLAEIVNKQNEELSQVREVMGALQVFLQPDEDVKYNMSVEALTKRENLLKILNDFLNGK